jgi:hypothetical protein
MKIFHWHVWTPVGVHTYNTVRHHPRTQGGGTDKLDTSIVLYSCPCGAHKTKELDGHWRLEQLTTVLRRERNSVYENVFSIPQEEQRCEQLHSNATQQ